eukprot:43251-Chlamydomonas_euryale.AAC.13
MAHAARSAPRRCSTAGEPEGRMSEGEMRGVRRHTRRAWHPADAALRRAQGRDDPGTPQQVELLAVGYLVHRRMRPRPLPSTPTNAPSTPTHPPHQPTHLRLQSRPAGRAACPRPRALRSRPARQTGSCSPTAPAQPAGRCGRSP